MVLLFLSLIGLPARRAAGQWSGAMVLANPHWNITLTDSGYSDFLLDNTPGFEGREYLSGEWGAAVAYVVGGVPKAPRWLEPQFAYPDWTTGSDFTVVQPITQTGVNADGLPIAQSKIANGDLEITLRHEMVDTVVGTPMGLSPASAGGSGESIPSSRYVLRQTCTLVNRSASILTGLQFFQFLHGLHSQRGVYDDRLHPGTLENYRFDVTLAGVDSWAVGAGSSSSGLEDYIAFQSPAAPGALEIGHYGVEGNGVDDHWSGKPSDGVHLSIADNWQTAPFSLRKGTDSFAPSQRWIAGAQRWELGTLSPGQSVQHEVLLAIRTGTQVASGPASSGGCNGGSLVPGGLDYDFDDVVEPGSCFASYTQADDDELAVRVSAGEFSTPTFPVPGKPAQIWNSTFSGTFSGAVHLTVGYDPSILPPGFDEDALCLYEFDGTDWQRLDGTVDSVSHTIAVSVPQLRPLALGARSITTVSITTDAVPVGAGALAGAGSYVAGSTVSLAAAAQPGFVFEHWSEGAAVVSTSPSFSFVASADRTLAAVFLPVGNAKRVSTTSLPVVGGTTAGDGAFAPGTLATVTGTPAPGYKFSKWLSGSTVLSTSSSYTFTVADDLALVAKFKPVYTVTITVEPEGSGEYECDPQFEIGEAAKLKAVPNDGYSFLHWTQNGVPVSNDPRFQFNVTGNRELVAVFAEGERIDTSSVPPHAGQTSGNGVYPVGDQVVLTALPAPGYMFVQWTENDEPVGDSEILAFASDTGHALVAQFALAPAGSTAPIAGSDTVHRQPDRALKISLASLLANDSSPEGRSLAIASFDATSANGGSIARSGNWLVFEPVPGSLATDSFQYTLDDGVEQASGLVTVVTDPPPTGPTFNVTGISALPSGEAVIRALGIPGRRYQLQSAPSLIDPVEWSALGASVLADGRGRLEFTDPTPANPTFYRVIQAQ